MAEDTNAHTDTTAEAPAAASSEDDKKQKKADKQEDTATTIHVKLYSPYKVYYDDDAESVSAENLTGPFDVLPRHHNFITLLTACEVAIVSSKTGNQRIKITRGVMHVRQNKVTIFLDV